MKTLIIIILFFVISQFEMQGQTFFPLKVGNIYNIEQDYDEFYHSTGVTINIKETNYLKTEILADTVIGDKRFFKILHPHVHIRNRQRIDLFWYDSLNAKLYIKIGNNDTLRIAADFNLPAGEMLNSYIQGSAKSYISLGISIDTIFNNEVKTYKMKRQPIGFQDAYQYCFAEGFGIYLMFMDFGHSADYVKRYDRIIMAIVDSIQYNYQNVNIDSITISPDRPISAIPFTIMIYTRHQYQHYLDSVYVEVIVFRDDTTKVYENNFYGKLLHGKTYYCFLNIPSSEFQVDDIVQYRVIVTDKSIFQTKAFSPDSGYHQFRILPPYPSSVSDDDIPNKFHLFQNYPNPFNNSTVISYSLAEENHISLKIYNILGEEIEVLVNQILPAGSYQTKFNAADLPGGVYICRLQAGTYNQNIKLIFLK